MDNPPNLILKKALKYGGIVLAILVPLVLLVVFLAVFYNPSGIWGRPSGTTYAAGVGCELKWPKGAASDDKIIGKVIDDYIRSKRSDSPMIKEFEGKLVGLGETIAKSTRNIVNPTILVGHALNETGFATNDRAVSSKSPCYNPFGRFASSSQPQCPVGGANGKQYYKFGSYSEAIMSQGPFMGRYLNGQIATASNLEDYVKTYVGTGSENEAEYVKNLREVNAELIRMAGGALGDGICLDSIGSIFTEQQGICPTSICQSKPLKLTSETNNRYGQPKVIILHYLSGSMTPQEAYDYFGSTLTNGNKDDNKYVQFVIGKDGNIYQFAAETKEVAGALNYNVALGGITISIENEGDFESANAALHETSAEIAANVKLIKYLMAKYNIPKSEVISHKEADVRANNPSGRRSDPGERFMNEVVSQL